MRYVTYLLLSILFVSKGYTTTDGKLASLTIEPARLISYELEDYFDIENDKHVDGTGIYVHFMPPNELYIEINYHKQKKSYLSWAQSKSSYWINEICKKYKIDNKNIKINYNEVQINP